MHRSRWLALASIIALVVAGCGRKPPDGKGRGEGRILSLAAVDDEAFVVWEAEQRGHDRPNYVTRLDRQGNALWTADLPDRAMWIGGTGPIVVVDGVVTVRYGHDSASRHDNSVIAFDLADGHVLWDHVIAPSTAGYTLPYVSGFAHGKNLIAFAETKPEPEKAYLYPAEDRGIAVAFDARTGARRWQTAADPEAMGSIVFGQAFARRSTYTFLMDLTTGNQKRLDAMDHGCAIGDEYLTPAFAGTAKELIAVDGAFKTRTIASPFEALSPKGSVCGCGRYGDKLVFLVSVNDQPATWSHEVLITDKAGVVLHRVVLSRGDINSASLELPDRVHGELPRHLPVFDGSSKAISLVMLDLETGTVAWRSPPSQLAGVELFRAGAHWVMVDGGRIVVFDATTGKLVEAVEATSPEGWHRRRYWPGMASDHTLWIFAEDVATPDAAPAAAIDLTTLRTIFARTVTVTDVTADARKQLSPL